MNIEVHLEMANSKKLGTHVTIWFLIVFFTGFELSFSPDILDYFSDSSILNKCYILLKRKLKIIYIIEEWLKYSVKIQKQNQKCIA